MPGVSVTLWVAATLAFLLLTLLPFSKRKAWWIRIWEFPRLQASITGLLLLLSAPWFVSLHSPVLILGAILIMAGIAHHAWWIAPFTRWHSKQVPDSARQPGGAKISLISANVQTGNRNAEQLLHLIGRWQSDVVLTLETDQWWENALGGLKKDYPHTINCPLDNLYGMHLFSKYPLIDPQVQFLVEPEVPSIHTAIALPDGRFIRAHFLHPAPPSPTENEESIQRDAELLIVAKSVREHSGPVLVAGDLNDVAWSRTSTLFRKISGLLDPRVGRGLFNTFHAKLPIVRFPLDHIFVSQHFGLVSLARLPSFGSDHFAIFAELSLPCEHDPESAPPHPGPLDQAEARRTTEAMDVHADDVHEPLN